MTVLGACVLGIERGAASVVRGWQGWLIESGEAGVG